MGRDAQKARKMQRKRGTVGATQPPGRPQGYHVSQRPGQPDPGCQCGRCGQ